MTHDRPVSRRSFLKGAGAFICLPHLPSLFPRAGGAEDVPPPRRMMFMCVPLGFVPNHDVLDMQPEYHSFCDEGWFPEKAGSDCAFPAVHADLLPHRQH